MVQRLPEDIIDPENPWDGDKLERQALPNDWLKY